MTGQVITFYSFKGGSGRSMAVANVAWILATNGKRVLVVDWDIEAPGLHRYFLPLMRGDPELRKTDGLIDRLWAYVELLLTPKGGGTDDADPLDLADLRAVAQPLNLPPGAGGALDFVSAGRQDAEYATRSQGFDWAAFYERFGGAAFMARLRERLTAAYDFVLIDSRTGLSDTAGVCTVDLPDTVVHCFVHNRQSVLGIAAAAESIARQQPQARAIRQYPVPMRVEKNVPDFEGNRHFARDRLDDLLTGLSAEDKELYWAEAEILYRARYAGGETLTAIADRPGERNTLLADMLWLAHRVSGAADLKAIRLSEELRETYQRAVALRDPREAELKTLARDPAASTPRLLEWLDELQREGVDSLPWIEKLTGATINASNDLAATERNEDALALLERAVETYRRVSEKRTDRLAFCLSSLLLQYATICLRADRLEAAISAAQECVDIRQSHRDGNAVVYKASLAEAVTTMARIYFLKEESEKAQEAAKLAINLLDDSVMNIGRSASHLLESYTIITIILNNEGNIEESKNLLLNAKKILEKAASGEISVDMRSTIFFVMSTFHAMEKAREFDEILELSGKLLEVFLNMAEIDQSFYAYGYYIQICFIRSSALERLNKQSEAREFIRERLKQIKPVVEKLSPTFKNIVRRLLDNYKLLSKNLGEEVDSALVNALQPIVGPQKRPRKAAQKRVPAQPQSM